MLQSLFAVLEIGQNNPDPIFVLSPTSVVHTYCRNHGDCSENAEVQSFINLLETKILEQFGKNLSVRVNRERVS